MIANLLTDSLLVALLIVFFNCCKIISDQEKSPYIFLSEKINVKLFFKISKNLGKNINY